MKCQFCGEEVKEGMLFCGSCGHRIERETKRFCTSCGKEAAAGQRFCGYCGAPLNGSVPAPEPEPIPEPEPEPTPEPTPIPVPVPEQALGGLLLDLSLMSMYKGEPKVAATSQATGTLKVYRDRLEMKKTFGNSAGQLGGLVGMTIAARKAQKDKYQCWYFKDMKGVHIGRYLGIYHTIVVTMKDGTKTTFASSSPAPNKIDNAVSLIDSLIIGGGY